MRLKSGMKSIVLAVALCFSAVALTGGGAEARARGGGGGGGGAPRGFAAPRMSAPRMSAPRFVAPRVMAPRYTSPRIVRGGAGPMRAPGMRYVTPPRYVAPRGAAPRYAVGAGAGRAYPRFLGHARRHFWRGRWLWVGVPLAAYAYDPCWTRVWTDWGWGWFYACGYDPDYGY